VVAKPQLSDRPVEVPRVRSMLMTVLGEYVAQDNRAIYRDTYVAALETLGFGTHAARQALARSVADGWFHSERVGRRSLMSITEPTLEMLRAGYPRIYGFGAPWSWDGRWLLVVVRLPEERRGLRDRMRTQFFWGGFGSLGGGLWISPHTERDADLLADQEAVNAGVLSFTAVVARLGSAPEIVSRAWDLDNIAKQYKAFVAAFSKRKPSRPAGVFSAQTAMVHAWKKFPFIDPDLPDELLPPKWPRRDAVSLFHTRHAAWADIADSYFRSLES
jgi:phenylacetic acid degradation operon negative regulatory protein